MLLKCELMLLKCELMLLKCELMLFTLFKEIDNSK